MDSIWTAISLMKPKCFMASVDLKDAYYSVRVSYQHQKYLKFVCKGTLYKFTCLPNGLASCPRKFTKLLKPVYSSLRQQGHVSSPYIDDSILIGDNYDECADNVINTIRLLDNLGFVPHPKKSVFIPTQILVFLGFLLNSITMTVSLTPEKARKLKAAVNHLLLRQRPCIREVAQVVGLIISSFPGVMYGPLHFRLTEHEKSEALKLNAGNFEAHMCLTSLARNELQWWVDSIDTAVNVVYRPEPDITIRTDASKQGWGCAVNDLATGGLWTVEEQEDHINYLEMLAVLFGLKAYKQLVSDKHVKVLVDNTTVQVTLNKMGTSHSPKLNALVKSIWDWCIIHHIWLTVARIPGKENIEADYESRKCRRNTEWCLDKKLFHKACEKLHFMPNIDLFASRINYQVKPFFSYHPDPEALAVNAFHQTWSDYKFYAFPPFSIISRVLQKIQKEQCEGLILVPKWPTQTWWPVAMKMLVQKPVLLPMQEFTLFLPSKPTEKHPLHHKMSLLLCHLSGNNLRTEVFRKQLQTSWMHHGDQVRVSSMNAIYPNGNYTVVNGKSIPFIQL
ncbi:Transposon Tf2-6 poly [Paramuricea clavata]|uniref:Transposon Tf2-6 poly n=1 Tax=Paramuricea clavata TaxID=317549 RepID=A0A6S7JK50_PARCT|nr:Transposon Tf2-6 poly [Paramuricea clavata]